MNNEWMVESEISHQKNMNVWTAKSLQLTKKQINFEIVHHKQFEENG